MMFLGVEFNFYLSDLPKGLVGGQEGITSLSYNWFLLGQEQMKNLSHFKQNDVPQKANPPVEFPFFYDFYFPKYLKSYRQKL